MQSEEVVRGSGGIDIVDSVTSKSTSQDDTPRCKAAERLVIPHGLGALLRGITLRTQLGKRSRTLIEFHTVRESTRK